MKVPRLLRQQLFQTLGLVFEVINPDCDIKNMFMLEKVENGFIRKFHFSTNFLELNFYPLFLKINLISDHSTIIQTWCSMAGVVVVTKCDMKIR